MLDRVVHAKKHFFKRRHDKPTLGRTSEAFNVYAKRKAAIDSDNELITAKGVLPKIKH